ncbi:hypothetical protein P9112_004655 [Eukaryota sp. TZLM1-RC]
MQWKFNFYRTMAVFFYCKSPKKFASAVLKDASVSEQLPGCDLFDQQVGTPARFQALLEETDLHLNTETVNLIFFSNFHVLSFFENTASETMNRLALACSTIRKLLEPVKNTLCLPRVESETRDFKNSKQQQRCKRQKDVWVCQTSFRGDLSNPPLHIISSIMSAPTKETSTPPSSTSSDVFHPTPGQTSLSISHSTHGTTSSGATHLTPNLFSSGQHPTIIHTSRDPRLPPPNTSSGQNPTPNLTLPSPELEALLATFSKEESEKQEPTDFVESLPSDTSLYPDLENCVSVQTLKETLEGFREDPLTSQVIKNSIELLDKESKELTGRPAERRIGLSPLDSS